MSMDASADDFAEVARAENTRRAYASDWEAFTSWCRSAGEVSLPAEPDTVARYLAAKAGELRVSTLARRQAAIRTMHRELGHPPPDSARLQRVWAGIRRTHGRPPRKKAALVTQDLRRVVEALPDTLQGVRDRAILLMLFAGALRRSEGSAITLEGEGEGLVHMRMAPQGAEIHIDRSKGDQVGQGAVVGVPYGSDLCPIAAIDAWLKRSGIKSGPIFRPLDRWGRIGDRALAPSAIAGIVKAGVARVGLNPALYAGHSLRAGLVTSAAVAGVPIDVIQKTSRHKRPETLLGYVRDAELFKRNAAGQVGL